MARKLRVLVVGAGIAGNATAYWLAKQGHRVTIIERYDCLRVNGLQLDLRGHGIEVMKLMGLEQAVRAKCVPEEGMALVDGTGRRRAFFAANKTGEGPQTITSEFEIMRGDLCRILADAAEKEGAKYVFGTGIVSYVEKATGIMDVSLSNGQTEEVDLLVGCDGQGSKVRRLMMPQSKPEAEHGDSALSVMSEKIAYFTMREEGDEYIGTGCMFPGPGKRMMLIRRHKKDTVQVYLMCNEAPGSDGPLSIVNRGDVNAEKKAFAEMFRGLDWRADDAVRALETGAEDFYCQHTGVVKLESWSSGHVTLVGDAGYGCPPDGFGTSMALVGAYILGGEIEKACSAGSGSAAAQSDGDDKLSGALKAYETSFGPHMKRIVNGYSAQPGWLDKVPWTPFVVGLFTNAIAVASYLQLDKLAVRLMPTERTSWKLPVYDTAVHS